MTGVYPLKHASVTTSKIKKTLAISIDEGNVISNTAAGDEGILAAIKEILTEKGRVIEDPRTNSLIITDILSNFPHIETTIARLDVPIPQILIEVEMLEVSKTNADKIGIKIGETPLIFTGAQRSHLYPWDQNKILDKGFETSLCLF